MPRDHPAPQPAPLTGSAWRALFDSSTHLTVGVEEELMLVDPESLDLVPFAGVVQERLREDPRIRLELPAAHVEVASPPCPSVTAAAAELADGRRRVVAAAAGWARVLSAGTHPFAAAEGALNRGPRYDGIVRDYRWAARRSMTCGLHVHVGVAGAERALAVYNGLRGFVPEICALAANAPFHEGRDTGLASVRLKLCDAFPRASVPPRIDSWDELAGLLSWGRASRSIPDATYLWWDVRPHPAFGTLEVRVADAQTSAGETAAVAAFIRALVAWLAERHDAGERPAAAAGTRIDENRWLALRDGMSAELIDVDTGRREPARRRIARLLEAMEPVAARLGDADALAGAHALVEANGADRQRAVASRVGLRGLAARLVEETERVSAPALGRASAA